MELKLKTVHRNTDNPVMIFASIEAHYGYEGAMYDDILRINYHCEKKEAYLTITCLNPGIGMVAERVAQFISSVMNQPRTSVDPFVNLIESMGERLLLQYDPDSLRSLIHP